MVIRRGLLAILTGAILAGVVACSGSDDLDSQLDEPTVAAMKNPLELASQGGCVSDDDCDAGTFCFQRTCSQVCVDDSDCEGGECSDRGRCTDPENGGENSPEGVLPGLEITSYPETIHTIEEGMASVTLEFGVSGELPPEGLAYRVWRSDGQGDETRVRHATGDDSFSITLAAGDADPSGDDPGEVAVSIYSALGDIEILLSPEPAAEGIWETTVEIEQFGGQFFEFDVHLLGDGAPQEMEVAVPVEASLYSPLPFSENGSEYVVAQLEYHSALDVYQAVFRQPFEFTAGLFGHLEADQVERFMRFDFEADPLEEGRFQGRFLDSWAGLYNEQDGDGEREVGSLTYTGDFTMSRVDSLGDEDFEAVDGGEALPGLIEAQSIASCEVSMFDVGELLGEEDEGEGSGEDDEEWSCAGIDTPSDFEDADAESQIHCALAVSQEVHADETTSDQLATYFAEDGEGSDLSFEQFLQACADESDDACQPSERAACAFEVSAMASRGLTDENFEDDGVMRDLRNELMIEFVEMSREAFLARQLGAFYTDMDMRRDWLRQSSAPAVFLDAVEEANRDLLDDWEEEVLDVHRDLFTDFFTSDAVMFMGRDAGDSEVNERRRELLTEASALWRSYAEALLLGAQRWNEVVDDNAHRQERAAFLRARATELYLTMGILMDFNRAAEAGAQSSILASNFSDLIDAIDELAMPFDEAVFARDAEVVTARSLDPLSDNDSLLRERAEFAMDAVDEARLGIDEILDDVTIEALQEEEMRNRLNSERQEVVNNIASICGLPRGCSEDDLLTDEACVQVEAGACGLLDMGDEESDVVFDPSRVAASEAGSAALSVLEAFDNVAIQRDELEGHIQKLDLEYEELYAFKRDVESWNQTRLQGVEQLSDKLSQRQAIEDNNIESMLDNLEQQASMRQEGIEAMGERFSEWNQMRIDGATSSMQQAHERLSLKQTSEVIRQETGIAAAALDTTGRALPKSTGTSTDTTSVARATAWFSARTVEAAGKRSATAIDMMRERLGIQDDYQSALGAAEVAAMEEQVELDSAISEAEMAELEAEMMANDALAESEINFIRDTIELMKAQREAELAYERDMAEFRERRMEHYKNIVDTSGIALRLERSRFNILQRQMEYEATVQDARLESSRLIELDRQLTSLDSLVGGIGAIFSQSHGLERTERHLNQAREALMDWLVVIEYYSVRPFIDQRIQIKLARNAYQLEEIAENLLDLQQSCGGSERSKATAELSLRHDVLGLTRSTTNDATDGEVTPKQRFQNWLRDSHVPVDRRIRYSTSESLSNILNRTDGILAATFPLGIDDFANLPLACNGKLESIALQVVGDVGDVRPAVSLLYDGTSQLRSCQPNISEYVEAFGQGMTSYGTITNLRTSGRSMSPLAGVNEFPSQDSDVNRTLAGLPVASDYTLLIDTEIGDNDDVDWDKVEDIKLEVEYSYQDLFPDSCD